MMARAGSGTASIDAGLAFDSSFPSDPEFFSPLFVSFPLALLETEAAFAPGNSEGGSNPVDKSASFLSI